MMHRKWIILSVLFASLLLAFTFGFSLAQEPQPPGEENEPLGSESIDADVQDDIIIQGRLTDKNGVPLNGTYSITAALYSTSSGGTAVCSDEDDVDVTNGLFMMTLDYCDHSDIDGRLLYLGIKVGSDAEMTPRKEIAAVPYAHSLRPGAIISSTLNTVLTVRSNGDSPTGGAIEAFALDGNAVYGSSTNGFGGYFLGGSSGDGGVYGEANNILGVGVWGENDGGGIALYGNTTSTGTGVPTLYLVQGTITNTGNYVVGASSFWGTRMWRVDGTGKGFFNGGTQNGGADFAEQMNVKGDETEYEPGDVLVINVDVDRTVSLSSIAFDTTVIGVYSTQPGVLAGAPDTDDPLSGIPVAITGIVPCKVSAENGAIHRGDLLVTSSIPGHAMRAGDNPPQGTVLGKALGELKSGTGVIYILVTLQ
jgi:hypothetical protein